MDNCGFASLLVSSPGAPRIERSPETEIQFWGYFLDPPPLSCTRRMIFLSVEDFGGRNDFRCKQGFLVDV